MHRRNFIKASLYGSASLAALSPLSRAFAQTIGGVTPEKLNIVSRSLEVNGKAAKVMGLLRANGSHGLELMAGSQFTVDLNNQMQEPTLIHWHGLLPPWEQDGVPDNPLPMIASNEMREYRFPVGEGGTHWMHAHTLQEQNLLAAPLIVRTKEDLAQDEQDVVVLLHDFSFTSPEELLANLQKSGGHGAHGGSSNTAQTAPAQESQGMNHGMMGHNMGNMMGGRQGGGMMGQGGMMMNQGDMSAMDLNDINYDAYLANDRTLDDPEVFKVEKGGRVRLRIINGATATAFTLDVGALEAELIAVDGHNIFPVKDRTFPISMGQRMDLRLNLPKEGGVFPILALREGENERTGIILATEGADIKKISALGESKAPVVGLNLEGRLKAHQSLPGGVITKRFNVMLNGTMDGYTWSMMGREPLNVTKGDRVMITMHNPSMMSHPMHLHGHRFQVVGLGHSAIEGAVRDTVVVPPHNMVSIVFDANNPGHWPFHCHHLYHMVTGMMTHVIYDGFEPKK